MMLSGSSNLGLLGPERWLKLLLVAFFWEAYLPTENTLNGNRPRLVKRPRAGPTPWLKLAEFHSGWHFSQAACRACNSKSQFKWPHTTLLRYLSKVP